MKIPVNVAQVLKMIQEMGNDTSSDLAIDIVLDQSAPEDVRTCIARSFTPSNDSAHVYTYDLSASLPSFDTKLDLVVVVAGFSHEITRVVDAAHNAGIPALVVTTMPDIVCGIAREQGSSLQDVVTPGPVLEDTKFSENDDFNQEPYPLTVDRARSLQMNIGAWIVDVFQKKRMAFASSFAFLRFPLANELINAASLQNAGIGFVVIIPGADMPVMTLNQMRLVLQIASIYGAEINVSRLRELACVMGSAFGWRALARELCDMIPGLGWALKAGVGYSGTQAVGRTAVAYFEKQAGEDITVISSASPIKNEYVRLCQTAHNHTSVPESVRAVATTATKDAKRRIDHIGKTVGPKVERVVETASAALGTTPDHLGKTIVESLLHAAAGRK